MKKQLFLFLLIFPLFSFVELHKFYVSVTEMEYRTKKKSLQMITRVFTDDFEDVLQGRYSKSLYLSKENEHPQAEAYIEKYVLQKMQVKVNGKLQELNYVGKEYENDMVLLYIEAENVPEVQTIEVENTLLFDFFPEQKNIVHVEVNNEIKSLLLYRGEEKGQINF